MGIPIPMHTYTLYDCARPPQIHIDTDLSVAGAAVDVDEDDDDGDVLIWAAVK